VTEGGGGVAAVEGEDIGVCFPAAADWPVIVPRISQRPSSIENPSLA